MQTNLLDDVLERHLNDGSPVYLTLKDNTALKGAVKDYDSYVVMLGGERDSVVYRHSILKAADAAAHKVEPKKEVRPPAPVQRAAPPRPAPQSRPQQERPPRPKRPPVRPTNVPQPERAPEAQAPAMNPMAEKMAEWLKKQKGGG